MRGSESRQLLMTTGLKPPLAILALAALLSCGCFQDEQGVPSQEALRQAAIEINSILGESRLISQAGRNTGKKPSRATANPLGSITMWYHGGSPDVPSVVNETLIEMYNESGPSVPVRAQFIGSGYVAQQKLVVTLAAGEMPELSTMDRLQVGRLAGGGRLEPVSDLVPRQLLDDLFEPLRDACTYDGTLFALPQHGACTVLLYNKTLFEEVGLDPNKPPATWDELASHAQKLTVDLDGNGQPDRWGFGGMDFMHALWGAGGELLSQDGTAAAFDSESGRKALRFMLDLRDRFKVVSPHHLVAPGDARMGFMLGKVAMIVDQTSLIGSALRKGLDVGVGLVPGEHKPVSRLTADSVVVFSLGDRERRQAVSEFLSWMYSPKTQATIAARTYSAPTVRSALEDDGYREFVRNSPAAAVCLDALQIARSEPFVPDIAEIQFVLHKWVARAALWKPAEEVQ